MMEKQMEKKKYKLAKAAPILGKHEPKGATVVLAPIQAAPFLRGGQLEADKPAQKKAKD